MCGSSFHELSFKSYGVSTGSGTWMAADLLDPPRLVGSVALYQQE